jgi:glycosyltransferase involved in cell wall biosynthesis
MDHAARCSIVIRAFNEEKHIGRLLTGVLQQTMRPAEIVLVDSGSTDATLAIAARFPVHIISVRPEEFSFGRSLNRGISETQSELVVLASAHVYPVYSDWLEQLVQPLSDPQVALSYGQQRGYEGTRFSEHQVFAKWFPEGSESRQPHPFCNNANAAIRRSLWAVHPYDETLSGLEDLAWASWAMGQGRAIAYVAEAPVIHVHEETLRLIYNRYRREAMALRSIRPGEHFHLWDFVRLYAGNVASDMARAWREKVFLREAVGILSFRWMQLWGTYRGFAYRGPLSRSLKRIFYYPGEASVDLARPARQATPIDYRAHGEQACDQG